MSANPNRLAVDLPHPAHVRAELPIAAVFRTHGIELSGRGRELRASSCPVCGVRSRSDAVSVNAERGLWRCHVCCAGGDALGALAGFVGLDCRRDFRKVIALAADLVKEDLSTALLMRHPRADVMRSIYQRRAEDAAKRVAEQTDAVARARLLWRRLTGDHANGRSYLLRRGIDPTELIRREVVRFHVDGSPAVAMFDESGDLVNMVTRRITPGNGPKVIGLRGCPTLGSLVGLVPKIRRGVHVVVVEGLADTLTAVLAWPEAVVLGAHGASRYPDVVRAAARQLVAMGGGRLGLALDDDAAGRKAGERALELAAAEHFDMARIEVVELGEHHDLAEAWCAGWRP